MLSKNKYVGCSSLHIINVASCDFLNIVIHRFTGVTFISATKEPPVQYLVTLTKQDEVLKIKQELLKLMSEELNYPIVIAEVFDNHIAKILVNKMRKF